MSGCCRRRGFWRAADFVVSGNSRLLPPHRQTWTWKYLALTNWSAGRLVLSINLTFPSWAEWVCCPADQVKAPRARGSKPASNFINNFVIRFEGNCDWLWNDDHIRWSPCIGWSWSFQVLGKSGWSGTWGWVKFCKHKGDFDGFYLSRQERVRSLWRMLMLSKEGKICKISCYIMFWSSWRF